MKKEEITAVEFQWHSSFLGFAVKYDGIHITILRNEIQVREMLWDRLVEGRIYPMDEEQQKKLFGLLEEYKEKWNERDALYLTLDGGSWEARFLSGDKVIWKCNGNGTPPEGEKIRKQVESIIGEEIVFEAPPMSCLPWKYRVITLCGSTRFRDEFLETQKRLTLEGNIVISVGLFGHSGDEEVWQDGTKKMLDDMHKRKIDMADEIFVINVGGYIGESTRSEIEYAQAIGKKVSYLEP